MAAPKELEPQTAHPTRNLLYYLAQFVSYIFHPVFMPAFMTYVLYRLAPLNFVAFTDREFKMWLITVSLNSILYPVLVVLILKGLGFLKDIRMPNQKDRYIPLISTMIFYFWNNLLAANNNSPLIMHVFTLGCFWAIIILFLITIFKKISMHTTAAGGALGILFVLSIENSVNMKIPLFVVILIAGIVGTARLQLKAHKPGEIYLGYAVGIVSMIAAYIYLN